MDICRQKGVPEDWIEELCDAYESGFLTDRQTIYFEEKSVNQFEGVHDLQLAYKLGEFLGVDTQRVTSAALGWPAEVRAIREAVEED